MDMFPFPSRRTQALAILPFITPPPEGEKMMGKEARTGCSFYCSSQLCPESPTRQSSMYPWPVTSDMIRVPSGCSLYLPSKIWQRTKRKLLH